MMKENTEHCCCEGCDSSPETLLGRIGELASEYRGKEGALISVLHMAQGIYGYLPWRYKGRLRTRWIFRCPRYPGWFPFIPSFPRSREESTRSASVSERRAMCGAERRYRNGFRSFWM